MPDGADPHVVKVTCGACGHVYELMPVVGTPDSGYYSSDRDFCMSCGSSDVLIEQTWQSADHTRILVHEHIQGLSAPQLRALTSDLYDILYVPEDKDWSMDTLDEVVQLLCNYGLRPRQ
jgi:hypothetical protein